MDDCVPAMMSSRLLTGEAAAFGLNIPLTISRPLTTPTFCKDTLNVPDVPTKNEPSAQVVTEFTKVK